MPMLNPGSYFRFLVLLYANVFPDLISLKKQLHSECLNVSNNTVSWLLSVFTVKHRGPQKKHKLLRNRIFKLQWLMIILLHSQVVPQRNTYMLASYHHQLAESIY